MSELTDDQWCSRPAERVADGMMNPIYAAGVLAGVMLIAVTSFAED